MSVECPESPGLLSPVSPEGEGLNVSSTLESAIRETTIHPSAVRDGTVFSFSPLKDTEVRKNMIFKSFFRCMPVKVSGIENWTHYIRHHGFNQLVKGYFASIFVSS